MTDAAVDPTHPEQIADSVVAPLSEPVVEQAVVAEVAADAALARCIAMLALGSPRSIPSRAWSSEGAP